MRIVWPSLLRKISQYTFLSLLVAIPITAFPWTVSPLEINKQAILFFLATACILSWFGHVLLEKSLRILGGRVWLAVGVYFGLVLISAVFSLDRYTSLFGQIQQEYSSLATLIMLVGAAFVGTQMTSAPQERKAILAALFGSAFVGVLSLFAFVGVSFPSLPTNLVGTPNALAVYLLIMSVVGSAAVMYSSASSKRERVLLWGTTSLTFVSTALVLCAINYALLWVLAILGGVSIFGLALLHPVVLSKPSRSIFSMILLVGGVVFLLFPSVVRSPFPAEVALSTFGTWAITSEVFQDGRWAFGTGPGTFALGYARYHGAELNATTFWDTQFDRGSSGLLTLLTHVGIFATLLFLIILGWVSMKAFAVYRHAQHPHAFPVLAGWVMLLATWCVYPQNLTLSVLFWVFFALVLRTGFFKHKTFAFEHSPRTGFVVLFSFVVCAIVLLTISFAIISKYRADVAFAHAITQDVGGEAIDQIIISLDDAASMNRWSDVYYRNLGRALLEKVAVITQDPNADPNVVKSLIGAAVNSAIRATELGPNTVTNWELRGDVYRQISPFVADAAPFSVTAYQEAVRLAPNNPRYSVGLARGYLAYADILAPIVKGDDAEAAAEASIAQDDLLQRAFDALMNAVTLKSDYAEARYYLAAVEERQGKLADAVASMEIVRAGAPRDVGVGLQLALLYLRQGKSNLAQQELERIIAIAPNFSNAHWYLAAVLEGKGDIDGALFELQAILAVDENNETVQKKVEALRAGQVVPETIPEPLTDSGEPLAQESSSP